MELKNLLKKKLGIFTSIMIYGDPLASLIGAIGAFIFRGNGLYSFFGFFMYTAVFLNAIIFDLIAISIFRASVKNVLKKISTIKVILLLILSVILIALAFYPLFSYVQITELLGLPEQFLSYSRGISEFMLLSNLPSIIIASSILLIALTFVLNNLIWGIIKRPIYALQKYQIIKNKKLLFVAGILLCSSTLPQLKPLFDLFFSRIEIGF